jgi:hypothetical protein
VLECWVSETITPTFQNPVLQLHSDFLDATWPTAPSNRVAEARVDEKAMRQKSLARFLRFQSDNRKSKTCTERSRSIENRKWAGLFAIVVALTVGGARVEAQQTGKVARIGFLDSGTASGSAVLVEAFRQEMRKFGWIDGKNITIEYRFAEQKAGRLAELATDLVRLKVDVIVAASTSVVLAAKRATTTIPIVFTNSADPVGAGLVASLARPGGNVTGLSSLGELYSKRLEILKDAVPKLSRVGLLRTSS